MVLNNLCKYCHKEGMSMYYINVNFYSCEPVFLLTPFIIDILNPQALKTLLLSGRSVEDRVLDSDTLPPDHNVAHYILCNVLFSVLVNAFMYNDFNLCLYVHCDLIFVCLSKHRPFQDILL